ncbi:DUF5825 family protein [Azospirillum sp. ST 5-10]|uniref:DUF5825 family protein n=1 Tax=unclassified Azospirillum TaxID=2630922 RepID=UPI003F49D248
MSAPAATAWCDYGPATEGPALRDAVLGACRAARTCAAVLTGPPLDAGDCARLLGPLADTVAAEGYDLTLGVGVRDTLGAAEAALLRRAGVAAAALAGDPGDGRDLERLATVRRLAEQRIRVAWSAGPDLRAHPLRVAHLPPPDRPPGAPPAAAPPTLTHAGGPGFVRIRDRRHGGGERTVTLTDVQARIYRCIDEVRTAAEVERAVAGVVEPAALGRFLDRLAGLDLVHRAPDGRCVALPLHRKLPGGG